MKKKWDSLSDTKKNILEIVLALTILLGFFAFRLYSNYMELQREIEKSHEKVLVTEASRYFTTMGSIQKYLRILQSGDKDDIMLILNDEYEKEFSVRKNNVMDFVPLLDKDEMYDYVGREMYQKRISKNVVEYYVYGDIRKTYYDGRFEYTPYNLTVVLYENKFLYSIRPGVSL